MTTAGSSSPLLGLELSGGGPTSFLWRSGAILVFAGMATGAFGSHLLKGRINAEELQVWGRAATYAMVNGLGLMIVSMHRRFSTHRFAGTAILAGGVLFSGSIMMLLINRRLKFLGPITPLGGALMMAGYLSLAWY